mmetsp:Transcript_52965/g.112533  ORF Transcript_52965/g.112533 Transcript_52965/m.112533 type:complete len:259 (-) Transcript_52965:1310-2086(-)
MKRTARSRGTRQSPSRPTGLPVACWSAGRRCDSLGSRWTSKTRRDSPHTARGQSCPPSRQQLLPPRRERMEGRESGRYPRTGRSRIVARAAGGTASESIPACSDPSCRSPHPRPSRGWHRRAGRNRTPAPGSPSRSPRSSWDPCFSSRRTRPPRSASPSCPRLESRTPGWTPPGRAAPPRSSPARSVPPASPSARPFSSSVPPGRCARRRTRPGRLLGRTPTGGRPCARGPCDSRRCAPSASTPAAPSWKSRPRRGEH